jgi:hypothetical protein
VQVHRIDTIKEWQAAAETRAPATLRKSNLEEAERMKAGPSTQHTRAGSKPHRKIREMRAWQAKARRLLSNGSALPPNDPLLGCMRGRLNQRELEKSSKSSDYSACGGHSLRHAALLM